MPSNKSVLLEQINIAVQKKWSKNNSGAIDYSIKPASVIRAADLQEQQYTPLTKNLEAINKLEQKVESLENLTDQLFYFINFLVENLPDMIVNILHSESELLNREIKADNEKESKEAPKEIIPPCPTKREKDILDLLIKGYCAKEIADRLFISETSVITHKKNLKEKFNARNTMELISKAHRLSGNAKNNTPDL